MITITKNSVQITKENKIKVYKLNKKGLLYFLINHGLTMLLIFVLAAFLAVNVKTATEDVNKCFEENSHLTYREKNAICTMD